MSPTAARLDAVSVTFGKVTALDRVSVDLPSGAFTAVIGPNGCGKSTLLRTLTHLNPPTSGTVEVLGRPVTGYGRRELARTLSLFPQQTTAPPSLTVAELVARGRHPHRSLLHAGRGDDEAIARAVERAGVGDLLDRPVHQLSGGQRQRAWLAMVLAQDTPVVLLDEPTTYLDLAAQYHLLDICADLVENGRTVVAVLHDLPQAAAYADHLVLLEAGRLVAHGTPREVLTSATVEQTYGIACRVDLDDPRGPVVTPLRRRLAG